MAGVESSAVAPNQESREAPGFVPSGADSRVDAGGYSLSIDFYGNITLSPGQPAGGVSHGPK